MLETCELRVLRNSRLHHQSAAIPLKPPLAKILRSSQVSEAPVLVYAKNADRTDPGIQTVNEFAIRADRYVKFALPLGFVPCTVLGNGVNVPLLPIAKPEIVELPALFV